MFKWIAVTNRRLCTGDFLAQVEKLAKAGYCIILREKDLPLTQYEKLAESVLAICRRYGVECTLHFYPEAARDLGCHRLHLPLWKLAEQPSLAEEFTVGVSVHSPEEAAEAQALGAAYVTAGHVFATDCKKGLPPRGLEFLAEVCRGVAIPVYGIGGITWENGPLLQQVGAAGVCMMSSLMQNPAPPEVK